MRQPCVDDVVCLTADVPELGLHRGDMGVIQSTWCAPMCVYEIEFRSNPEQPLRALVLGQNIELKVETRPYAQY